MSKISIQKNICGIEGLCLIEPSIIKENLGCFFEYYNEHEFCKHGLNLKFIQDNQVYSKAGVLRGDAC